MRWRQWYIGNARGGVRRGRRLIEGSFCSTWRECACAAEQQQETKDKADDEREIAQWHETLRELAADLRILSLTPNVVNT